MVNPSRNCFIEICCHVLNHVDYLRLAGTRLVTYFTNRFMTRFIVLRLLPVAYFSQNPLKPVCLLPLMPH